MDLNKKQFTLSVAGKDLQIEVSDLASQTNGSVLATYGGTTILATVVMDKEEKDLAWFPLTVDFEEKFYSVGKILGGQFIRREGRPSEDAVLSGRIVDRVIRPLFDQRMRRGIQVVLTVLSYDEENSTDFVSLMAASIALSISDIPWGGPVAGLRVSKKVGEFSINPLNNEVGEIGKGELDAFIAGTEDRINMVEMGGYEVREEDAAKACQMALEQFKELTQFQKEIVDKVGKDKTEVSILEPSKELVETARNFLSDKLDNAMYSGSKAEKTNNLKNLEGELKQFLEEHNFEEGELAHVEGVFEKELDDLVHKNVLEKEKRPDGRRLDEVRKLYAEVGTLPRMHGTGIFVRGDTQALAVTTLGAPGDQQTFDTIKMSGKSRFMLHYNFPPFSVGEARSFRGPGRRDIGHGALAKKAIEPLMPKSDEFPYAVRVVSEILSSNGSSSMATVSASSLSLMDAGVPLKKAVGGIAMGLILGEEGRYKVLTDIQGPEDHYGDMDFKVAGTRDGINAIQLDVKINGVTIDMVKDTLAKATQARLEVLDTTDAVLNEPRAELSQFAPRILTTKINPERIGELIGPGGKVINGLIEETGVESIDIDEDGTVMITTSDAAKGEMALARVNGMMREFTKGEMVEGDIIKMLDFGAIVDLGGGKDGMIHVSELKDGFVDKVEDVVKLGDHVRVKIISAENGKVSLSLKQADK